MTRLLGATPVGLGKVKWSKPMPMISSWDKRTVVPSIAASGARGRGYLALLTERNVVRSKVVGC